MSANPFETLGVEPRFDLDIKALEERHRTLSGTLHPDRYAGKPATERRMALDQAIAVNTAWRALRDPVKRAESLLTLQGVKVGETAEPQAPPALLMEMMDVHEELVEARQQRDLDRLAALRGRMQSHERSALERLTTGFSEAGSDRDSLTALLPLLGELRYLHRFFEQLDAIEDQLLS